MSTGESKVTDEQLGRLLEVLESKNGGGTPKTWTEFAWKASMSWGPLGLILLVVLWVFCTVGPDWVNANIETQKSLSRNLERQTENIAAQTENIEQQTATISEVRDSIKQVISDNQATREFTEQVNEDHRKQIEAQNKIMEIQVTQLENERSMCDAQKAIMEKLEALKKP